MMQLITITEISSLPRNPNFTLVEIPPYMGGELYSLNTIICNKRNMVRS